MARNKKPSKNQKLTRQFYSEIGLITLISFTTVILMFWLNMKGDLIGGFVQLIIGIFFIHLGYYTGFIFQNLPPKLGFEGVWFPLKRKQAKTLGISLILLGTFFITYLFIPKL